MFKESPQALRLSLFMARPIDYNPPQPKTAYSDPNFRFSVGFSDYLPGSLRVLDCVIPISRHRHYRYLAILQFPEFAIAEATMSIVVLEYQP